MGNRGTFGWKGKGALEFPAGSGAGTAPDGRARLRFNESSSQIEASIDGSVFVPFAGGDQVQQTDWYVDPASGSDSSDGSLASPLRTLNEFFRRMTGKVATVEMRVYLLGDDFTGEGDRIVPRGSFPLVLYIIGQHTIIRSGTITSRTVWDHTLGAPVQGTITDTDLTAGSWSDYGGVDLREQKIILTSGANAGAYSFILSDEGAKKAKVKPWWNQNTYAEVEPGVGDTYTVVTMTRLPVISPEHHHWIVIQDCQLEGNATLYEGPVQAKHADTGLYGCKLLGEGDGSVEPQFWNGSFFAFGSWFGDGVGLSQAYFQSWSNVFFKCTTNHVELSLFYMGGGTTLMWRSDYGMALGATQASVLWIETAAVLAIIADQGARDAGVIQLRPGSVCYFKGKAYSVGALQGFGVWCASGTQFLWNPYDANVNTKVHFGGTPDADFNIGLTTKTIAQLGTVGFVEPTNNAMAVPTRRHPQA